MPYYRRLRIAGATYFFTVNLADRTQHLLIQHVELLRIAFQATEAELPFTTDAIVILPEHLHCIWTLPRDDADYSSRWQRIKARFSRGIRAARAAGAPAGTKDERPVWQPRYWEHVVRNDDDLRTHLDYIHYNPVKHGHVARVADWPYSSFHRYVRDGYYPGHWASAPQGDGPFGET